MRTRTVKVSADTGPAWASEALGRRGLAFAGRGCKQEDYGKTGKLHADAAS